MSVIYLNERRLNNQLQFERSLLKELTLEEVQRDSEKRFKRYFPSYTVYTSAIREEAIEQAIEAFLLGAEGSEKVEEGLANEEITNGYLPELRRLSFEFFDYMDYWNEATGANVWHFNRARASAEQFFLYWFQVGIEKGIRRRKLKMK
ncbi:hypothetical protein N781_07785 [Pontibacillus halophilus JSM 076056 = DSM 19796]|uniref:DUF2521 family protein n=1 Tax=Pontibacillus halophilus JSM 076056 = DSM 19796 TaxID=1385510 RepID=A0A0A5GH25_9BACI|nr:DUF2521 family protein [Pontibacillus halophilus]KGX90420.1 hypothetical protein N781_07785 [Pontibacillus halophilus JSM 076056 = DSM 19796]